MSQKTAKTVTIKSLNRPRASLLATGLWCAYRKAATAATEEMRSIFEGNLRVFIGLPEKSGSFFLCVKVAESVCASILNLK